MRRLEALVRTALPHIEAHDAALADEIRKAMHRAEVLYDVHTPHSGRFLLKAPAVVLGEVLGLDASALARVEYECEGGSCLLYLTKARLVRRSVVVSRDGADFSGKLLEIRMNGAPALPADAMH
jgi:hypothetical protein